MAITAEGFETQQQVKVLCGLGCLVIQGYVFSEPLPRNELALTFKAIECRLAQASRELSAAEAAV